MSAISVCVQDVLEASATVIAEVAADRISVPSARQGDVMPYVEHVPVAVEPVRIHGRLVAGSYKWTYQVSVFHNTMGQAEDLAFIVKDAMDGYHAIGSPLTDELNIQWMGGMWYGGREPDNEIERFILQFEIAQTPA